MKSREEYIRTMQAKLEEWNALKTRQEEARKKIEELQHAGESALGDMKSGVELAWTALGEAIDSARSRFK